MKNDMGKKICLYDYIYFGHHKNYIIYYTTFAEDDGWIVHDETQR